MRCACYLDSVGKTLFFVPYRLGHVFLLKGVEPLSFQCRFGVVRSLLFKHVALNLLNFNFL